MQTIRTLSFCSQVLLGLLLVNQAAAEPPAHCGELRDDGRRLDCYDRWYAQHSPVASVQEPVAPQDLSPSDEFGSELLRSTRRNEQAAQQSVRQIESKIQGLSQGPRGKRTYALANGQVWRQAKSRAVSIRAGDTVTIRRSRTGSYSMATVKGAITKVVRVR